MEEKPTGPDFYPAAEDYGIVSPGRNSRESAPWYFTKDGNRQGPVPYSDLREKAKAGILNPRTDLVWTKGMTEWAPSGDVGDLFERVETSGGIAPIGAVPTSIADPYQPPVSQAEYSRAPIDGQWPGARRRSFLFVSLILPFLIQFGVGFATPFLNLPPEQLVWLSVGPSIFLIVIGIYFTLQRLANLGMSRWWYFANFIPFLNFWVGYRCFACPAGYAVHKKMDGAGIFLAIIYWLLVVLLLAVIGAFIALALGYIGSPELQQQIRDALEQIKAQSAVKP